MTNDLLTLPIKIKTNEPLVGIRILKQGVRPII